MEFVLIQMSAMLEAPAPTPSADLALLWDYRAAYFHITSPQNSDAVKYAHEKALDVLPLPPQNSADAEIIVNVLNNVAVNLCHRNNYEGAYQIHKRIRILRDQFPPTGYSQSLSAQNCNFIMACVKSGHTNEAQATLSPTEHKILESAGLHSTDYLQFLLAKSVLLACISDDLQCAVTVSTFCHLLPAVFPDDDRIQNQYLHALRQELAPYRSCSSRYGLLLPDQY